MQKKIIIGLFGVSLSSVNYGVTALGYSQIKILQDIAVQLESELEYWIFSDENNETIEKTKELLSVNNIVYKNVVRIRTGIAGLVKIRKNIKKCDIIIDLTYGDSFSDIYGLKNFWLFTIPKLISIKNKKMLILGPQTIGPFYKKNVKRIAKYILKKADYVVVRDALSLVEAQELSGRADILLSSDLAMELPYDTKKYCSVDIKKLNIGLNVSVLLWERSSSNSNFEMSSLYRELIYKLLEELISREYVVHLITHVYEENRAEYKLAEDLHKKFPSTVLSPYFENPIDAKNYISNLDVFIGSRMHATIAAFSSGVPVIPISYSRKFEGLYETIDYNHVIQCKGILPDKCVEEIMGKINSKESLLADTISSFAKAKGNNEVYKKLLKQIILEVLGDNN